MNPDKPSLSDRTFQGLSDNPPYQTLPTQHTTLCYVRIGKSNLEFEVDLTDVFPLSSPYPA